MTIKPLPWRYIKGEGKGSRYTARNDLVTFWIKSNGRNRTLECWIPKVFGVPWQVIQLGTYNSVRSAKKRAFDYWCQVILGEYLCESSS